MKLLRPRRISFDQVPNTNSQLEWPIWPCCRKTGAGERKSFQPWEAQEREAEFNQLGIWLLSLYLILRRILCPLKPIS